MMRLAYLDFDHSEDAQGVVTWDAMASVTASRVPELVTELDAVLRWASQSFNGRFGPVDDGGDWDLDLQAQDDAGQALPAHWDAAAACVRLSASGAGRTTVTLTLTGNAQFAQAFAAAWCLS